MYDAYRLLNIELVNYLQSNYYAIYNLSTGISGMFGDLKLFSCKFFRNYAAF